MVSPDNILMYLAPEHEREVRAIFDQLHQRGFPRQNQTPHITITFSPSMSAMVVEKAADLLPALMPAEFRRVGTVVFGTKSKQTVAWLLEADEALEAAARQLSSINPNGRGDRWIPHLTMGLRIPRGMVPEYVRALDELTSPHLKTLRAPAAAFWSPRIQKLTVFD